MAVSKLRHMHSLLPIYWQYSPFAHSIFIMKRNYKITTNQLNTTDMSFSPKNSQRLFQKHVSLPKMNGDPSVYNNLVDGSITPSTVLNNTFCCSVVLLGLILKLGRSIQNWRELHWRSTRDNLVWGEIKLYTKKNSGTYVGSQGIVWCYGTSTTSYTVCYCWSLSLRSSPVLGFM